jgi:hypothetical protein
LKALRQNEERERIQPGWIKKITRDGSSYEIHAPFDVWDGHIDGEQCAEISHSAQNKILDLSQASINPVSIRREKSLTDFV